MKQELRLIYPNEDTRHAYVWAHEKLFPLETEIFHMDSQPNEGPISTGSYFIGTRGNYGLARAMERLANQIEGIREHSPVSLIFEPHPNIKKLVIMESHKGNNEGVHRELNEIESRALYQAFNMPNLRIAA